MTPQQLLKQTQLAAGVGDLTKWHEILIEKGRELKDAKAVSTLYPRRAEGLNRSFCQSLTVTQTELEHQRELNDRVKDQVEKYRQRLVIQENVRPIFALGKSYRSS